MFRRLTALALALSLAACSTMSQVDVDRLAAGILEVAAAVAPNSEAREFVTAAQAALAAGDLTMAAQLLEQAREAWKREAAAAPAPPEPAQR